MTNTQLKQLAEKIEDGLGSLLARVFFLVMAAWVLSVADVLPPSHVAAFNQAVRVVVAIWFFVGALRVKTKP